MDIGSADIATTIMSKDKRGAFPNDMSYNTIKNMHKRELTDFHIFHKE